MKSQVEGNKILVIGMARSGQAAVKLLLKAGASRVIANDQKGRAELESEAGGLLDDPRVTYAGGGHPEQLLEGVTMVIKSPGVKPHLPILKKAAQSAVPVYSEIELAYGFSPAEIVGITGTNGKTTTTSLVGEILKKQFHRVYVAGNIGFPLCEAVDLAEEGDVIVAELSSFQLENTDRFRASIAAILNISPDHMDYHGTMEQYIVSKSKLLNNQYENDVAVLNHDDQVVRGLSPRAKGRVLFFSRKSALESGVFMDNGNIVLIENGKVEFSCPSKDLRIPGPHNLENALAAVAVSWSKGVIPEHIAATLRTFPGVPHRLEFVAEKDGVTFINDSKGTNLDATLTALKAIHGPKILIAGGLDKGSIFDPLIRKLKEENVHKLILLGETAPKIKEAAVREGFTDVLIANSIAEAVVHSYGNASKGDTVLLSPACASWDMFKNFEERGDIFKSEVLKLEEGLYYGKSPHRA